MSNFKRPLVATLAAQLESFKAQFHRILGFGLKVDDAVSVLLAGTNRIFEVIQTDKAGECVAADLRLIDTSKQLVTWTKRLEKLELYHLKQPEFGQSIREFRINKLHRTVYSAYWERIEARFKEWNTLRCTAGVTLSQIREAVANLDNVLNAAEKAGPEAVIREEAAATIEMVQNPPRPRPAPDRKRDKRLRDQQIRSSMKGAAGGGKSSSKKGKKQTA